MIKIQIIGPCGSGKSALAKVVKDELQGLGLTVSYGPDEEVRDYATARRICSEMHHEIQIETVQAVRATTVKP